MALEKGAIDALQELGGTSGEMIRLGFSVCTWSATWWLLLWCALASFTWGTKACMLGGCSTTSQHPCCAAVQAGVLLYLRKIRTGLLNGKSALQSIEFLELALNLIGVSTSLAASVVAYHYLSLRKKAKGS